RDLLLPGGQGIKTEVEARESVLPSRKQLFEFFRVEDCENVRNWQLAEKEKSDNKRGPLEAELKSGVHVQLRSRALGRKSQAITMLPTRVGESAETSRVRAELLSLSEWLDQGAVLFDADENVRLLNLRFAQLAGLAPEEVEKHKTLDS